VPLTEHCMDIRRTMEKTLFIILLLISFPSAGFAQQQTVAHHRPKIGVVLSGGGALGFAHVGVLKVIDSLGIPVDYIAGTSFGGLVGGLYAAGYRSDSLQTVIDNTDWKDLFSDTPKRIFLPYIEKKYTGRYNVALGLKGFTPILPSGAIAGQKISLLLSRLTYRCAQIENFDSLPIPFRCVSVDLITGKEVVLNRGPLAQAMRATMSFPSVFTPVPYGDSLLIDGGVLNNYPANVLKAMGADIIIGVDVSGYKFSKEDADNFAKILDRATSIPRYQKLDSLIKLTDIYIAPRLDGYGIMDFDIESIHRITNEGTAAAEAQIGKLRALKKLLDAEQDTLKTDSLPKKEPARCTIHGIRIVGNERLDFLFIYSLLNMKPGSFFSPDSMEQQITMLYSLGYFESITYTLSAAEDNSVDVTVCVKERRFHHLNIGLRYDDYYKLVALVGIRSTNLLFPGTYFESEVEFPGILRAWMKYSYPSRSLDHPVYPFVIVRYENDPLRAYLTDRTTDYKNKSLSAAAGTGLTFGRAWNIELKLVLERSQLTPNNSTEAAEETKNLCYAAADGILDYLDDVFVPRKGVVIKGSAEYSQSSFGSSSDYLKFSFGYDAYATISAYHTFRLKGDFMTASGPTLPLAKEFFIGGPDEFVGADYQQIVGTRFVVIRAEYRYQYKRDIFLKGIVNTIFDPNALNVINPTFKEPQFGYGAAVMFTSILGNLELTIARGNKSYYDAHDKQILFHFSAGVKF
jgi:NTE family protein